MFKKTWLITLLIFLLLAVILKYSANIRQVGYDKAPDAYPILDERTYIWQGMSLRRSGVPSAWSGLAVYKKNDAGGRVNGFNIQIDEELPTFSNFRNFPKPSSILHGVDLGPGRGMTGVEIVQPFLDAPPFAALLYSYFVPESLQTFSDVTPFEMRKGPLFFAILTGALIFFLGWQLFKNPWIGLLAALVYGTAPTFILLSRYTLLENIINPLNLICLNLLLLIKSFKKEGYTSYLLIAAGVVGGLTALSKITGWAILPIGVILLWQWKYNLKNILCFSLPLIFLGSLYFIYGIYYSPGIFWDIFRYQGAERGFIGSINFLVTMTRVGIVNFPIDGWWIGGFLSLALISFKKENLLFWVSVIILLITPLLLGGANYPWYFLPLIPFMCLALAFLIWEILTSPTFFNIMIFFLLLFSSSFYWGYGVYQAALSITGDQQPFAIYRLLLLIFLGAGLAWSFLPGMKNFSKIWFIVMLVVFLIVIKLNERSIYYLMSHWGSLPSVYTPGTF